tara:strand:+ start:21047 stop:21163 length:117 start_codon:yes stop_codon:yes gene_type:complete
MQKKVKLTDLKNIFRKLRAQFAIFLRVNGFDIAATSRE